MTYPNGVSIDLGNELTPAAVKVAPKLSWDAAEEELFTLIFFDPDAPSRENPRFREYRHWLVVNIIGSFVDVGDTVVDYKGPTPPKGTGPHRYIFLIYKQPNRMPLDQLSELRARYTTFYLYISHRN